MRYELIDYEWDYEWAMIKPFLPNKPRDVPRVNDRRVPNGIFWVLRSGTPLRDLPHNCGPYTTCYNRFVRWRRQRHQAMISVLQIAKFSASLIPQSKSLFLENLSLISVLSSLLR